MSSPRAGTTSTDGRLDHTLDWRAGLGGGWRLRSPLIPAPFQAESSHQLSQIYLDPFRLQHNVLSEAALVCRY